MKLKMPVDYYESDKVDELIETVNALNNKITNDMELLNTTLLTTKSSSDFVKKAKENITNDKKEIIAINAEALEVLNNSTAANIIQESVLEPVADKIPLIDNNGKLNYKWLKPIYIPEPDLHLPLRNDLFLKKGVGIPTTVDIDSNQNGLGKITIPNLYQASITRNSIATYMSRGIMRTAQPNEPRFETDENGNPLGILTEGESKNLIKNSFLMNDWDIIGDSKPTIIRNLPDLMEGNNAVRVISSEGNSDIFGIDTSQIVSNKTRTFSIWVKRFGNEDVKFKLFMANDTNNKSETFIAKKAWKRFSFTSENQKKERFGVVLENIPKTIGIEVFAPQVEELPFASSYIPTNGEVMTRQIEKIFLPATSVIKSNGTFTVSHYSSPNGFDSESMRAWHMGVHFRGGINRWGADSIGMDGNTLNIEGSFNKGKYLAVFDNLMGKIYSNGVFRAERKWLVKPAVYDSIYIGSDPKYDNSNWFGHIKDFKVWNSALTNEQIYFLGGVEND